MSAATREAASWGRSPPLAPPLQPGLRLKPKAPSARCSRGLRRRVPKAGVGGSPRRSAGDQGAAERTKHPNGRRTRARKRTVRPETYATARSSRHCECRRPPVGLFVCVRAPGLPMLDERRLRSAPSEGVCTRFVASQPGAQRPVRRAPGCAVEQPVRCVLPALRLATLSSRGSGGDLQPLRRLYFSGR
jgi:hypothetical protein